MSEHVKHKEAEAALQVMGSHITATQDLLERADDRCIAALRQLAKARSAGNEAIAAMLGPCIGQAFGSTQEGSEVSIGREIDQLIELVNFCLVNLCSSCRQEIGQSLRE